MHQFNIWDDVKYLIYWQNCLKLIPCRYMLFYHSARRMSSVIFLWHYGLRCITVLHYNDVEHMFSFTDEISFRFGCPSVTADRIFASSRWYYYICPACSGPRFHGNCVMHYSMCRLFDILWVGSCTSLSIRNIIQTSYQSVQVLEKLLTMSCWVIITWMDDGCKEICGK